MTEPGDDLDDTQTAPTHAFDPAPTRAFDPAPTHAFDPAPAAEFRATPAASSAAAPPGWYPDPSVPDHHRFWTGYAWSGSVFPSGPSNPQWAPSIPRTAEPVAKPAPRWPWLPTGRALAALTLAIGFIVGFGVAFGVTASRDGTNAAPPTTTAPPVALAPSGPVASALSGLVVRQSDLTAGDTVQVIPAGDQVSGQTTLDLCNGTFPSESLRTARLQVAAADAQGSTVLSTEAVLYQNPAATIQAFNELRSVAAQCPATPVVSPVGEPTVTTRFSAAPDSTWPQVPTVDRLAFDFVSVDPSGLSHHAVAVYLRRGRALMGLYFQAPDGPQPSVSGQTTIPDIVNVFATKVAQLPSSVVG
jgi:hypothetical protein